MRRLSDLPADEAERELRACCGSTRWVTRMLSQRPFKGRDEVFESADRIWNDLGREDWLEAFTAHPRIGEQKAEAAQGERAKDWSSTEQAGMAAASDAVKAELAQINRDYEAKFGWIYLVCATGCSAEAMVAFAKERMGNTPDDELRIAAAEQAKITKLRLEKLLEIGS